MKKTSIHTRIVKNQLIVLLVTIIVMYINIYFLLYFSLMNQTSKYQKEELNYINNHIDTYFENIENQANFINLNQELRSFLVYHNQLDENKLFLDQTIQNEISFFINSNAPNKLHLFNLNTQIITDNNIQLNTNLNETFWYKDFTMNQYKNRIYRNSPIENTNERIISYVFGLYDFTETSYIGFAKFDISPNVFKEFLDTKIASSNPILILDEHGNIISSYFKDLFLEAQIISEISDITANKRIKINNNNFLINKHTSAYTNWTIVSSISINDKLSYVNSFGLMLIPIILFILLINIFVSYNTSLKIVKPIKILIESIKIAEKGDLSHSEISTSELREISELSTSYSNMITEINYLVEKNHKMNLLRIESQLTALQQKIDPHFLFNTLELISSKAIIEGANSTSIMTQKLGNLFRYNLKTKDFITIKEELNYIKDYLYLNKIGFDEELTVLYNTEESIFGYIIPKLTLQPILENTIKHGFGGVGCSDNIISIDAYKDGNDIIITIKDNGIGMTAQMVSELNASLKSDINNFQYFINRKEHIGLRNANARLCLLYNMEKALFIQSSPNKGTTITLSFDCNKKRREIDVQNNDC